VSNLHTYEGFLNEAKMNEELKSLYEKYAKKVGWLMQINDIRSTSGDVNARENKYNIEAKESLFQNFFVKEEYKDKNKVIPAEYSCEATTGEVPNNIPILYYANASDEDTEKWLKDQNINEDNLYNKRDLIPLSADKITFGKTFAKYDWLPKTVYSKKEAVDGAVGFPVIAKIKDGHSGKGIEKFDSAEDLEKSKDEFDLFCQFIDFKHEYRVVFCQSKIIAINERVPTIEDNKSIKTKKADEKISFTYVYQDLNKVDKNFLKELADICKDIKKDLDLNLWSLDVVQDKKGKLYVMETSSAMGLGSVKMCEVYRAIYEDFYGEELHEAILEDMYKKYVVNGHKNYWPKYKKEIESSQWPMDYEKITNENIANGYRYFFNIV
jgi:hypothetical protein